MEKGKIDIGLIKRYLRGELSPREMYALERRAQDDPMLMDTILGIELADMEAHGANLIDIRKRIAARTRSTEGRIRRLAPAQRWAVAASVLFVLTLGTFWFTRQQETLEQSRPAVASAPTDAGSQRLAQAETPASADTTHEAPAAKQPVEMQSVATPPVEESMQAAAKNAAPAPQRLAVAEAGLEKADVQSTKRLAAASKAEVDSPTLDTAPLQTAAVLGGRVSGARLGYEAVRGRMVDSAAQLPADTSANKPVPKKGWHAYNRYLQQGAKQAEGANGTVALTFRIDDEGTPTDIQVIHSSDTTLNERAIQLVRDGGKWSPGKNGGRSVELQLTF